jgi:hypothetical protein
MATTLNISDLLKRVYGPRGLPFPGSPNPSLGSPVAGAFPDTVPVTVERSQKGAPLRAQNALGRWVFLPAKLGGVDLPNPLVTISGEKSFIETDLTEVGTVFEKAFQRPYDISIICTLINAEGTWPEAEIVAMEKLYREGDLYTLECAETDIFLQPRNNFLLQKISLLDMGAVENAQVVQLDGRSNIDFELEIL